MKRLSLAAIACILAMRAIQPVHAEDGEALFDQECADCHSFTKNKKGPNLTGVVGRPAGTIADFTNYSDAMKASGITWTLDKIAAYVTDPRAVVPAGTMKYDGLADQAKVAAIVAYLQTMK